MPTGTNQNPHAPELHTLVRDAHLYEMHAYERYAYEIHAYEVHAYERYTPIKDARLWDTRL
jgi:hypothetical protein